MIKRILLVLVLPLLFAGCTTLDVKQDSGSPSFTTTNENATKAKIYKAVYLEPEKGGELTDSDLKNHPEVFVVHTGNQLVSAVKDKIAIWIDKDSVDSVDINWLQSSSLRFFPKVVVGYNNPVYAFSERLHLSYWHGFGIRPIDWSKQRLEPGFSVAMWKEEKTQTQAIITQYDGTPNVLKILNITNALLEGKDIPSTTPPKINY